MPKITKKENEQIIARFNAVAPNARCSLCGHDDFGIPLGITPLPLQLAYPQLWGMKPSGDGGELACAPLICKTCGNVYLINLRTLGELDHLITYEPTPEVW